MGHLHIFLIPMIAHGHMIPTLDMAKLLTSRGLITTIISTPAFSEPIRKAQNSGFSIGLKIIKFPPEKSHLPSNIVSLDQVTSDDLIPKFFKALSLLQEPLEKLIQELSPNCLISDMFLPWTNCCAAKFNIPRLVFHGISYLSLCCSEQMRRHRPFDKVLSDSEQFVLPNLPHEMKFVRTQVSDHLLDQNEFTEIMQQVRDSDWESYGVVVNSFYELEPDYAHYYKRVLGRKAWNIGPLLLYNQGDKGNTERGKKSSIDAHECLAWLDTKQANSVVYVCFGSMVNFTRAQLNEIAYGLEASGQDFIWVVRKREDEEEENDEFLPKGFADRLRGRGLIIRGWAPQVVILGHIAIGAFVTHCGWNSTLEGVCAGVPMVTWPLFAEQFFNEKLVTEVLRIGAPVGSKTWRRVGSEGVDRDAVAKAVEVVMAASEMRSRVGYYKEMAGKAVGEGGSSYDDMSALIEDLSACSHAKERTIEMDGQRN
ncbi:scopoletin glucosyltransferase [Phtheirospermum japonicum]|uniref:Glycosyltransferase n=1 Tax=Phtheirospermum japonicum TaxID=374723 RepID=A0A830CXY4_9LAMI|nr:scopoletin glucosyltransferase [Phtheirospermum japonicum]